MKEKLLFIIKQNKYLMSIQIDNHNFFNLSIMLENKFYAQSYICIGTKTTTLICRTMMKATSNIQSPTSFKGQLTSLAEREKILLKQLIWESNLQLQNLLILFHNKVETGYNVLYSHGKNHVITKVHYISNANSKIQCVYKK